MILRATYRHATDLQAEPRRAGIGADEKLLHVRRIED